MKYFDVDLDLNIDSTFKWEKDKNDTSKYSYKAKYRGFNLAVVTSENHYEIYVGELYTEGDFSPFAILGEFTDLEDAIPYCTSWIDDVSDLVYKNILEKANQALLKYGIDYASVFGEEPQKLPKDNPPLVFSRSMNLI